MNYIEKGLGVTGMGLGAYTVLIGLGSLAGVDFGFPTGEEGILDSNLMRPWINSPFTDSAIIASGATLAIVGFDRTFLK